MPTKYIFIPSFFPNIANCFISYGVSNQVLWTYQFQWA